MADTYLSEWQPKRPGLVKLSELMRGARDVGNKARIPEAVPLLGGTGLGELLLGKTPEAVERIGYDQPLTTGSGQTLSLQPDIEELALMGLGGMTNPVRSGAGKATSRSLVQAIKENAAARGAAPAIKGEVTGLPLLPRSQGMYTPDVPQVDLARQLGRGGKYTERMQDLLDSRAARKKVDELIGKGEQLGMREWYGTEPLRQAALNEGLSQSDFDRMLAHMASASQRNPVDQQNKMGSYLWMLDRQGMINPDTRLLTNKMREQMDLAGPLVQFPEGLGSLAQGDIFGRSKQLALGADPGTVLPEERKLGTFYRNLQGNLRPVTVDVNAVRGPVITHRDPRWLETKVVDKDETGKVIGTHTPRADVAAGRMSLKQARERPGFWLAAPEGSDYAGFEDLWQRAAKRAGVKPAEAQALGWYGSADVTALKTKPELYVDNLERLIKDRAQQLGLPPTTVLQQMLRGEQYLR